MITKIVRADESTLPQIKSCTYTQDVNGNTDVRVGCVSSASIEVSAFASESNAPTNGERLTYYQVDDEGNETKIGVFYAEPTITTKNSYSFVAYDAVKKLDVDFSEHLATIQADFPMTLMEIVEEAANVAGVTLASGLSFPLSTLSINAFSQSGITCRQIFSWAAEIAGRFVRCNADGEIIFDWYATASDVIAPSDTNGAIYYKQDGLTYEKYETSTLDRVRVYQTNIDVLAYVYPQSVTDGNTYDVSGNLLLLDASDSTYNTVAQNIYNVLTSLGVYRPCSVQLFPFNNPFKAGDKITITDSQGVTFNTIVMSITINDSGVTLTSTGNEEYANASSSLDSTILALTENAKTSAETNQYFWFQSSGMDAGAHITQIPKNEFQTTPSGGNTWITTDGLAIRNGMELLAEFFKDRIRVGKLEDNQFLWSISNNGFDVSYVRELTNGGYKYFENTSFFYTGSLGQSNIFYEETKKSNATLVSDNSAHIILDLPKDQIPIASSLSYGEMNWTSTSEIRSLPSGAALSITIRRTIQEFLDQNIIESEDVTWILEQVEANNYTHMGAEIWDSNVYSLNGNHNILSKAPSGNQYVFFTSAGTFYPTEIEYSGSWKFVESSRFSATLLAPDSEHDYYRADFGTIEGNENLKYFGWKITNGELVRNIFLPSPQLRYNALPPFTFRVGTANDTVGMFSASIGEDINPIGKNSLGVGLGVTTGDNSLAIGKYNDHQDNNVFEIGNGESDSKRSNALTVDWSGILSVYNVDNKLALNPLNDTIDFAYTDPTTQETFSGSVFVPDIVTKNNPILNGIVLAQSADNSGFHIHNTRWDATIGEEVPTNISALGSYTIYDVNDYPAFYMQLEKTNADLLQQSFILQRDDGTGNNISHGFLLQIGANSNPLVVFPSTESRDAWANGLNVVKKAGDTMTGDLTIQKSNPHFYTQATNVDITETDNGVSANTWSGFSTRDKNDYAIAQFFGQAGADGNTAATMWVYNRDTAGTEIAYGYFRMTMNKSGAISYSLSNPAAFCNAIGVGTRLSAHLTENASVASSSTFSNLISLTIPTGIWVVIAAINMQNNNATIGSFTAASLGSTTTGTQYARAQVGTCTGNTVVQISAILNFTASTTVYLNVAQGGGVTRAVVSGASNTYIVAVRIASR